MTKQLENIKKQAEDFQKEMEKDIARTKPDYSSSETSSSKDENQQ